MKELRAANLQALLHDLGSKLVHAILRGIADHMIDSSTAISWSTMLADVLDAPIAELPVGNDINGLENLFDARTLGMLARN